jgi:CHAT domain-containing protein
MLKPLLFISLILLSAQSFSQTIPPLKGKTDSQGKRQADWIIWYDEEWKETTLRAEVKYYRNIIYKDDIPSKLVKDYYANGVLQMQGSLLKDRPQNIFHGWVSYYYETGKERIRVKFANGEFANEFLAFRRDGTKVTLPWDEPLLQANEEEDPIKRIKLLTTAMHNAEALFNNKSLQFAERLEELAYEYFLIDDYKNAASLFDKTYPLFLRNLDSTDERIPDVLYFKASCYEQLQDFNKMLEALEMYFQVVDKHHAGNHSLLISALNIKASYHVEMDEHELALPYFEKAFQIVKANLIDEDNYRNALLIYFQFLNYCMDVADWNKALEINNLALINIEQWEGRTASNYIEMLGIRSTIERSLGSGTSFKETAQLQYELTREHYNTNDPEYAKSLINRASFEIEEGNYAVAESLLILAKDIYIRHNLNTEPAYGTILSSLATIYHDLANENKEQVMEAELGQFYLTQYGELSYEYISHVIMGAMHAMQLVEHINAEAVFIEAITLIQRAENTKALSKNKIEELYANAYSGLGLFQLQAYQALENQIAKTGNQDQKIYWKQHKDKFIERAETFLKESIKYSKGSHLQLRSQTALMILNFLSGDFEEADQIATEAQQSIAMLWGENHPQYADILISRAVIHTQLKLFNKAFTFYQNAFSSYKHYSKEVVPYLSETERQVFFADINARLQQFTAFILLHQHELPEETKGELFEAVIFNKSLGLNHLRQIRQELVLKNDSDGLNMLDEWKSKKEQLVVLYKSEKSENELKQQILLENELNQLERNIAARSHELGKAESITLSRWTDIAAKLKEGEALVEILKVQIQRKVVDTSYIVIVLTHGKKYPDIIEIPGAPRLENKPLRYYHNAIRFQLEDRQSFNEFWKPIKQAIGEAGKIYLSPDGLYNKINIQTLLNPETNQYLIDEVEIEIINSSRQLLASRFPFKPKEIVMFGNPDFGGTQKQYSAQKDPDMLNRSFDAESISDLPGTAKELEGLAAIFDLAKVKYTSYTDSAANEKNVNNLHNPEVIHFATHGFFLKDLPRENYKQSIMGFDTKTLTDNPMLRSGLLLAGCRDLMSGGSKQIRNDGILSAYEVSNLELLNTQLVVMSACETGLGTIINGEGVIGLPRAFLASGVQEVLMSLWKVDDEATQLLMRTFYQQWIATGDRVKAWQNAQQNLRKDYPSPYYWGAFVSIR